MDLEHMAAQQARRVSLGVGHLQMPDDYVCPITQDVMVDPVVASDGHSYERTAIEAVLSRGNGLSPLTRETLTPGVLIPNHNLKKRIREHDDEVLQIAESARAAIVAEYVEQGVVRPEAVGDEDGERAARRQRLS